MKNGMKSLTKPIQEELEKVKKKYEKAKSQVANLKINEKKMNTDNVILAQKINSLNKENNELKHRLNKLVKADPSQSSSKNKNSSVNNRLSKGFGKKHSYAPTSPRMKKVLSDRTLIPLNTRSKGMFGRRETLDVNRSGNLMTDIRDNGHQEFLNIITSDDDTSNN